MARTRRLDRLSFDQTGLVELCSHLHKKGIPVPVDRAAEMVQSFKQHLVWWMFVGQATIPIPERVPSRLNTNFRQSLSGMGLDLDVRNTAHLFLILYNYNDLLRSREWNGWVTEREGLRTDVARRRYHLSYAFPSEEAFEQLREEEERICEKDAHMLGLQLDFVQFCKDVDVNLTPRF